MSYEMRLKELLSTLHRTWFVLKVEHPRSKLKECKSPRLRDLDFHRSLIHLPRRRQILQRVFKYWVSAGQLCTNLIPGHKNRADGRFPIHRPVLNEIVSAEVTHETGTRQISGSNPVRDNLYYDWAFSCSFSYPPGKCRYNWATTASFQILCRL